MLCGVWGCVHHAAVCVAHWSIEGGQMPLPPVCGISVALGWSVMSRYPHSLVDDIKVNIYAFRTS